MTPQSVDQIGKLALTNGLSRLDAPQLGACRRMVKDEIERMAGFCPHADQADAYYARLGWLNKLLRMIGD